MFKKSTAPSAAGGYTIAKSLRLRSSASAYLNRTPGTAGNRKTWTWSGWVKRGQFVGGIYQGYVSTTSFTAFGFGSSPAVTLFLQDFVNGSYNLVWETPALFRDTASWYHIIFAYDTTQASSANALKVYVNGVQQTLTFTAVSGSYVQNRDSFINATNSQQIGTYSNSTFQDGYMAEVNFIDGSALTPTSFGSFSGTGGVWQPIAYTGTYGTNGFYLKFSDATSTSTLGNDSSGNGNTWTTNNISVTAGATYDSMTDVPTLTSATAANYATLNPLFTNTGASNTFYYGNLELASNSNTVNSFAPSTIAMSSGKFYFEATAGNVNAVTGMSAGVYKLPILNGTNFYAQTNYRYFSADGKVYDASTSVQNYTTYTNNDVIGVALDLTNGKVYFAKNNTWQGSSDPVAGTSPAATGLTGDWVFGLNVGTTNNDYAFANFGQQGFKYTPPTGYVALNTYNLSTPTIAAGNKYMDATTYTGTGASLSVTNTASFKPDLVWIKSRSAATDNKLTDSVRGVTKALVVNSDAAETTDTQGLTTFGSGGFTVGTNTDYNNSAATYVGWQWQAGQGSTSSNTNGSITSTVSVSTTAGFSIVTYTGNGVNSTVGHGLGVVPQFIIVKSRSQAGGFFRVYSPVIGAANALFLNSTLASTVAANIWNSTTPTSSVFSIGTDSFTNTSGETYVGYCWTPIVGFSQFGSYTGNGSTDGPFVYTGFRPKFILFKNSSSGVTNWVVVDTNRQTYNVVGNYLVPNTSDAEGSLSILDILSNGFKVRNSDAFANGSGNTIVYAAFAENPFKYALAR